MKKDTTKKAGTRSGRARRGGDGEAASRLHALGVPEGLEAPDATDRLLGALSDDLASVYRLVRLLGEEECDEDDVVEWVSTLALSAGRVLPGQERAWVLRSVLRLIEASPSAPLFDDDLPQLRPRAPEPTREPTAAENHERLLGALQELDPPTRAAVVLVVHEGLSVEEAARIQGGSRGAFAERYAEGVALLGDDLIDVMLGRQDASAGA